MAIPCGARQEADVNMCRNWRVGSVYLQCYVPETLPRNAGRRRFDRSLHGEGLAETEAGRSHNANTYYKHKKKRLCTENTTARPHANSTAHRAVMILKKRNLRRSKCLQHGGRKPADEPGDGNLYSNIAARQTQLKRHGGTCTARHISAIPCGKEVPWNCT